MVRSIVRATDPPFEVWRCPHCASIHALNGTELASERAQYPDRASRPNWRTRALYRARLARLQALGLNKTQSILEYGCEEGGFVRYLHEQGYTRAFGFDSRNPAFSSRASLDMRKDCIVALDVLGQVESPHALLSQFSRMLRPKALIMLGTPSAEAIDLERPDTLAAAFAACHRHIPSRRALMAAGMRQGWQLERFYPRTVDAFAGPPLLQLPLSLLFRLFDGLLSRGTHGTALFRAG
jgi:SAM-dependent methyltransferase